MNKKSLGVICVLSTLALATGCGAGREVTVSGDISTADGVDGNKPVHVEVYESAAAQDGAAPELSLADSFDLEAPGSFEQAVTVEGDSIHVVALIDANDNGKCDDGEAWGEADATVTDDTAQIALRVAAHAVCPAVPAAE